MLRNLNTETPGVGQCEKIKRIVSVVLLEEVSQWGWAFRFQKLEADPPPPLAPLLLLSSLFLSLFTAMLPVMTLTKPLKL